MLEETERVGKARLEAAQCLERILVECKRMRTDRANRVKMVCTEKFFFVKLLSFNCYQVLLPAVGHVLHVSSSLHSFRYKSFIEW